MFSSLNIKMLVDSLRNRDLALFFVLINLPAIKRIFLWSRHEEHNVTVPSASVSLLVVEGNSGLLTDVVLITYLAPMQISPD